VKNAVGTTTNSGNVDVQSGERTRVHPAAYGVIMDMLSGMYGNAAKAVLREYSVNGWDEHKKHGVERPVEVTLPSVLQPTLIVRDFGPGIPLDGVYSETEVDPKTGLPLCLQMGAMEVFGEYGNSSKRDTNTEAGGFGIGSKAAFALGHQFMVTGYKDGESFTVLFALNEDGTGTKSVLSEGNPTDQPNGLEISLGVEDVDAMCATATELFQFWDRGSVLVNGEEPTPLFESLEQVNDEVFIQPDGRGEAFAVMGPVAYPVDRALLKKVASHLEREDFKGASGLPLRLIDSSTDVYIKVPIGSVKPAPSREMLRDTDLTVRTLASVFLGIYQDSFVKVEQTVNQATTYYQAVETFHDLNEILGAFKVSRKDIKWQGKPIAKTAPVEMLSFYLAARSYRYGSPDIVYREAHRLMEITDAKKSLTVVGVPEDKQGSVSRFVKRYLEQNEDGVTRVFVTDADAVSYGWFQVGLGSDGARTATLEEWRAICKQMRADTPRAVNEPSYTTGFDRASRDLDDRDLLTDIIAEGKDIVVFYESARHLNTYERKALEGYTVVVLLATQSEDALAKRVEADGSVKIVEWKDIRPQAVAAAQAVIDGITDVEREAFGAKDWLSNNSGSANSCRSVIKNLSKVGEVTNSNLLAVEESMALAEEFAAPLTSERHKEISRAADYLDIDIDTFATPYEDTVVNPLEEYPLANVSAINSHANDLAQGRYDEDGNFVAEARRYWQTYSEEEYLADRKYLEHALRYINAV
jgi:hypothetical protein